MSQPTLALIDGMALVYRGHFAMIRAPRLTSSGLNTSCLQVFTQVMLGVFEEAKASHVAVVFDTRAPTFRHQRYPAYKATRDAMPEEIEAALPWLDRILGALRIPVLRLDGFEADDLIGTIAVQGEAAGYQVIMVTPDKDYAQLVGPGRVIWRPSKGGGGFDKLGVAEICAEWGIERPDQVIDILGLMGDSSDNVPGVPGIGPKTAKDLIQAYGDMAGVYANLDQVKGKKKENLAEHREQAFLSRELVTIDTAVPLDYAFDALARQEIDREAAASLFAELEFRSLGERLLGAGAVDAAGQAEQPLGTIAEVFHTYHLVQDEASLVSLLDGLAAQPRFCIDTETDGLEPRHCRLLGMSFCWRAHEAWYLPWPEDSAAAAALRQRLAPILAGEAVKVGHNLKFDAAVLLAHGLPLGGAYEDTMLAAWLVSPDQRRSMDALSERLLGYRPVSITSLIGEKGKDQRSMTAVPLAELAEYAAEDADVTWQLAEILRQELAESGQEKVWREVECPLIPVLVAMEAEGINIDVVALGRLSATLETRIAEMTSQINAVAGEEVNINSPKQLGELLFDRLQLDPKAKRTAKSKQYQTNEQTLQRLAGRHPIVQHILDYREATKLKSTYVDTLPQTVDPVSGRVHTHYEQAVAATGRLASRDPNLQNIPVRSEFGRQIRRAFVSRGSEYQLLSLDYSQIELRIAAELSGDPGLAEAFASGYDIHTATAAAVYGVLPDLVDGELRRRAKTVNFGILYGVSAFGLAERLDISRAEAKALIDAYYDRFSGLKGWMAQVVEEAQTRGWVATILGRRRAIPEITSRNAMARQAAERLAINSPVQGSAADLIKLAMIRVHQHLQETGSRSKLLLQVHDELVIDLHHSEREQLPAICAELMRQALPMRVPLEVEYGIADDWLAAH
ncbi:MAG: DNA polymerase I [Planctomycetota bacterium]|nr:MAG: DNA polymerase I [Planctomycetota bacterium]